MSKRRDSAYGEREISLVYFIQIRYSYVTSDRLTSPHIVRDKVESQDESPRDAEEKMYSTQRLI